MSGLTGQSMGRYHILDQLGQGGMATVYKAYDMRLERDVVIKVIRQDAFPSEQQSELLVRFEREAKVLARLAHPNIVPIIDYGEHDGVPYLVMPLLPGGTLKQRLGKPLPWQETFRLLLPIADALAYAHEKNILHRDVKPSNILLTQKGQPMLTDFGIAKILDFKDGQTTLTASGIIVGTPEYMSPEQGLGRPVGPQTDIYALGVVLYELLTGRKPFVADTPLAVVLKQATDPLPRPSQFVRDLPEAVEKILFKALAKDPADRYQSMTEMAAAMERTLSGQPSVVSAEGAWTTDRELSIAPLPSGPHRLPSEDKVATVDQSTQALLDATAVADTVRAEPSTHHLGEAPKLRQKFSWVWMIGLAVIFSLLVGGILIRASIEQYRAVQVPAVTQVEATVNIQAKVTTPPKKQTPSSTQAQATATTQSRIIRPENMSNLITLQTLQHRSEVLSVAFSPDGQTIASAPNVYTVQLWRVVDGTLLRTLEGHTDMVFGMAFSPDGQTLASGSLDDTVRLWRVSDGTLLRTLEGHAGEVLSVAFSPDGQILASGSLDYTVRLWRASDGTLLRTLKGHTHAVNWVAFSPDGATLASGSWDGTVRLWRISDGALLRTLEGPADGVLSVAFSPDGATLAAGSNDGTVQLWRASDGTLLRTLEGHAGEVLSVAFSPDGQILASGSWDYTVRLWRTSDGTLLRTLEGHVGPVRSVAFSPDGQTLASAGDGTVRLWGVP